MRTPASEHVTLVEVLELTQPFEEFAAAVQAAARRLEVEGIKELVTLQFYADPASTEVGTILTFTDRNRMMKHIDMITGWEEFERFFGTVKPIDVRVYGKLSAEAEEWVGHFGRADYVVAQMEEPPGTLKIRVKDETVARSSGSLVAWDVPRDYGP